MSHRSTNSNQTTFPPRTGWVDHRVAKASTRCMPRPSDGVVGDVDAPRCLGTAVGDFHPQHVTVASERGC